MSIDALAVRLIAGRPLAPFANSIVGWQLANSVTRRLYTYLSAYSNLSVAAELDWLLRLNPVDLEDTARALHTSLAKLQSDSHSEIGIRVTIGVLESTGRPVDAEQADMLVDFLPCRPTPMTWRRIENYCDTDPIDPLAPYPTNLQRAIDRISAIEVSTLRASLYMQSEDHDLQGLTPSLARFSPDILVNKLRSFACDLPGRSGHAMRFLAFELPKISALLTTDDIATLLGAYRTLAIALEQETDADSDQLVALQYILVALLPHLDAHSQLDALLLLPGTANEMLKLAPNFKTFDPDIFAARITEAEGGTSATTLRRMLYFCSTGQTPLTALSRGALARCFAHPNRVIRLIALAAAAALNDDQLLTALAESNWSRGVLRSETVEAFYGSSALARVPVCFRSSATLKRMSPDWQASVIGEWGEECARLHADILIRSIQNSLGLPPNVNPAVVIQRAMETPQHPTSFPFLDTVEQTPKVQDVMEFFKKLSESEQDWIAENTKRKKAADEYIEQLKDHDAGFLVDPVYIDGFSAIANLAPDAFRVIIALLEQTSDRQFSRLANLIGCAAVVLSKDRPEEAAGLLRRFSFINPEINLVVGPAELPFHRLSLWLAADHPSITALRRVRLQSAPNDYALFVEALCAADAGKADELLAYVDQLLATEHPGDLARAVTLAGFCDVNPVSRRVFDDRRLEKGFLSQAAASARAAYERNTWARHWYTEGCAATDSVQLWRNFTLMVRAADERFVLWYKPANDISEMSPKPFAAFALDDLKERGKKKRTDREKTLFGLKEPSDEILACIYKGHVPRSRN